MIRLYAIIVTALLALAVSCAQPAYGADTLRLGNERPEIYLPLLRGKKVGLLSNHTGIDHDSIHTVDKLLAAGINVTTLFSPEHGFRGDADAGQKVGNSTDASTGLPVVSLYGRKSLPLPQSVMDSVDVFVVDLQDVGLRFYTYYITMLRLMEEAARGGKEFVVLDRPNPLGMTVDGPVLDMSLKSGVGALPIPVIHGMTLGELAKMIVGEGWMKPSLPPLDLTVVPMEGYNHSMRFQLLNRPSPNLKSMHAVYLYPSTCLFEGTVMSLGRGTDHPFEVYGHPDMKTAPEVDTRKIKDRRGADSEKYYLHEPTEYLPSGIHGDKDDIVNYSFTPKPMPGAKNPPLSGEECFGRSLREVPDSAIIDNGLDLSYIIDAYNKMPRKNNFFTSFFDKLIGNISVRQKITKGETKQMIRDFWRKDVEKFKQKRAKYLLYD